MTEKVHWFRRQEDCEAFFKRLAENEEESFSENLIIEGNSNTKYNWIITASNLVGYEKIGIDEDFYTDDDVDYIDTVYLDINNFKKSNTRFLWLDGDEVSLESDGIIRIWWD